MLLTDIGQVLTFGNGQYGRLGHGDTTVRRLPRVVDVFEDEGARIVNIVAGAEHTLALSDTGALYSWGNGQCGRLGHGNEEDVLAPVPIVALHRANITHVSAGGAHTLVTTRSGRVFAFGLGEFGQLGVGDTCDVLAPMRVSSLVDIKIVQTSAGAQHSCFLAQDGRVFACGKGTRGRLGTGDTMKRVVPELVRGLLGVVYPDVDDDDMSLYSAYSSHSYGKRYHSVQ